MPKAMFLPWSRIAVVCRRMAKNARVALPDVLDGSVSGEPFERDEQRLTALADFLERIAPEKAKKHETPAE